jgi:hypothetical protein
MSQRLKLSLAALAIAIVALTLGGFIGYRYATAQAGSATTALDSTEIDYIRAYLDTQLREGTDDAREDAIRAHIAFSERIRGRHDPFFTARVTDFDSAMDYTRLAILARKRGAEDEARQDIGHAMNYCLHLDWQTCNADKLIETIHTLDKAGIFK